MGRYLFGATAILAICVVASSSFSILTRVDVTLDRLLLRMTNR